MKVVIMAGGKGTRISSVASDIPKPMIKVEGIPVLEREIECLKNQGFDDIILTVSKSIAKVIGAYRQEDGYLEGGDCVVSWCLGHLAEYAAPEHYDERYENWRFEDLPILPVEWKLLVHNTKKPQFNVLRKLLRSKKFDYVVNACDAG